MNIEKIIWLAGLFEGEGTAGLYKYKRGKEGTWRINTYFLITNCDPMIINEVYKIADELGVGMSIYQRNLDHPIWSIAYQVICKNMTGTHKILTALYPYLCGNKKAVAEMTMRFVESREFGKTRKPYSEKDNKLYADCKQINCKGKDKIYLSSETLRSALANITKIIGSEDKVQTSMKVGETIPQEL